MTFPWDRGYKRPALDWPCVYPETYLESMETGQPFLSPAFLYAISDPEGRYLGLTPADVKSAEKAYTASLRGSAREVPETPDLARIDDPADLDADTYPEEET